MKTLLQSDKTIIVELLSSLSFFLMSILLMAHDAPKNERSLFWIIILMVFSILQLIGVLLDNKISLLRLSMAWVSGSIWTWLAFSQYNDILSVPAFCIGIFNLYSFIILANKSSDDWHKLLKEED